MEEKPVLMIPGPVSVAKGIREAMGKEMIANRSAEFQDVYRYCQRFLKDVFGTDGDLVLVNGTGTASMEIAICNVVEPSDAVVCIRNGAFGERFEEISRRHANEVRPVSPGLGQSIDLDAVEEAMDDDVAVVTMVHAETSTGIVNPVREVGDIAAEYDALLVVDCVTSGATEEIRVDDWGVDLAMTCTQKGIGAPPGVSALAVSQRARDAIDSGSAPYYLDLSSHLSYAEDGFTPTTSSVPLFWALQEALRRIERIGLESHIAERRRFATAIREQGIEMGLSPFPTIDDRSKYSNGVTVLDLPDGISAADIVQEMSDRGILIRTGVPPLEDEVIRIGTMGAIGEEDVLNCMTTLQTALGELGYDVPVRGIDAAKAALE